MIWYVPGGVQEETTYLGIPCLTLRENTERPVTVTEGSNRLIQPGGMAAAIGEVFAGRCVAALKRRAGVG